MRLLHTIGRFIIGKAFWFFLCWTLFLNTRSYCDSLIVHSDVYAGIPRLTRDVAVAQWDGKELFQMTYASTMAYWREPVWPNYLHAILFVTDPGWHRIIYGDKYAEWIKSWGRGGPVEQRLHLPTDICSINDSVAGVGPVARVYLINHGVLTDDRIFRLIYSFGSGNLAFDDSLNLDTDVRMRYRSICLHDNSTATTVDDDYLWVVDDWLNKIVKYDALGAKGIQRTEFPVIGTGNNEFGCLGEIVCGRDGPSGVNNDEIYMLDPGKGRLVRLIDNGSSFTYDASYQFSGPISLIDLEVDMYGQIYVLDAEGNRVFKFNPAFELIGVFQPGTSSPDGICEPISISNPRGGMYGVNGWAELFVGERWTDTTGGQWFQIGTKLLNGPTSMVPWDQYSVTTYYTASDPHLLYVNVYEWIGGDVQAWIHIDTPYDGAMRYGGDNEFIWQVPPGKIGQSILYKLETTCKSTYKKLSGDPVDQFQFEVQRQLGNQPPAVQRGIRVGEFPQCVEYRTDGLFDSVDVVATDAEGQALVYDWYCSVGGLGTPASGSNHIQTAVPFTVYWAPTGPVGRRNPHGDAGRLESHDNEPLPEYVQVVITDTEGGVASSMFSFTLEDDCTYPEPPCPTLYVQTKDGYVFDNNTLAASEDTAQTANTLTDTYLLRQEPQMDEDGCIHLQLREDEYEMTTLDAVELIMAWVDPGREIGVSDDGEIFYPMLTNTPIAAVDGSGIDCLPLAYYQFDTEGITHDAISPRTASHSFFGNIDEILTSINQKITTLSPGEVISFSFGPIPEAPPGKVTRYALTFAGRYSSEWPIGASESETPTSFNLLQNVPNPFNEGTLISYSVPQDSPVKLEVYNILGQQVKTLVDGFESAGPHDVWWNGRDDRGKSVASGIYFYRFTTGRFSESKKMIVIK